jgi:hypothetical protein
MRVDQISGLIIFSMPNFLSLIYKMHGVNFGLNNKEQSKRLKFKLTESNKSSINKIYTISLK